MKKMLAILMILLLGCQSEKTDFTPKEMVLTPQIIDELKSQDSVHSQLTILYRNFEPTLDRSDDILGTDENSNGIRDDIEALLSSIQNISQQELNTYKKTAHYLQETLSTEYTLDSTGNSELAQNVTAEYMKVSSCQRHLKMGIDDVHRVNQLLTALTFNTKGRTLKHLQYMRHNSGNSFTMLDADEDNCK
ncbi:hypothetical protein [Vibrio sp. SCSIO 43136]|uniref:hypothetical protein n=1 Tax=Vibrio sp. SCSIO 43136 TaxID=2819101 RepID=UPI002076397F|nr:hypothetical protein [Vibrio sp. SCSIO 43136]USD67865.1 hypothetical protein J4N39_16915 [Vibrio sp. SCSIO 43136]